MLALLCLLSGLAALPSASDDVPTIVVNTAQADGRFAAEHYTNISLDAGYGQLTSPLADPALAWIRATNAVSHVRCYNWLGDGIPKNHFNWFSGCRVARIGTAGQPVYEWERLEKTLDPLVAAGAKPWIVCGGVPDALAAGPIRRNESGMSASHPADLTRYGEMVSQMVRRLEKSYGAEEVRSWHFEVWSQPDHEGSWEGSRAAPFTGESPAEAVSSFNRLYDRFAAAVLAVDEKLHVGGPGLAGDRAFLRAFLEHCARGANEVTGKRGTRLDFISWCRWGAPAPTAAWCRELRGEITKRSPELSAAEFVLCESGLPPSAGDAADRAAEAARMASLLDHSLREGGSDLIFRSGDLADDHFDGYRPLVTRLGDSAVPLPAFRFYQLLTKMGGERVKAEPAPGIGVIATHPAAKAQRNATQILLYRYDPAGADAAPKTYRLRVTGLPNLLRFPMRLYRIEPDNQPYEAWTALGKPKPAPVELGRKLVGDSPLKAAVENPALPLKDGEATLEVTLPANSVALVTLGAEPSYGLELSARAKRLRKAEEEYGQAVELLRSEPSKAVDALQKLAAKYADTSWKETALYSLVPIYEAALKDPGRAEAVRRELVTLPSVDDMARIPLLEQLRLAALRRGETSRVEEIAAELRRLDARLAEQRKWDLRRYAGSDG